MKWQIDLVICLTCFKIMRFYFEELFIATSIYVGSSSMNNLKGQISVRYYEKGEATQHMQNDALRKIRQNMMLIYQMKYQMNTSFSFDFYSLQNTVHFCFPLHISNQFRALMGPHCIIMAVLFNICFCPLLFCKFVNSTRVFPSFWAFSDKTWHCSSCSFYIMQAKI